MTDLFKDVPVIKYEGPKSKNPFSFKQYNPDELIGGKTMKEHLRFAMAYWHTMTATGTDPFGVGTAIRPYEYTTNPLKLAEIRVKAAFEFMEKLGIEYFCFHDCDIAPQGANLAEFRKNLDKIVPMIKEKMKETDIKCLWGTANVFGHPRYVHGASTSPNFDALAFAGAQVKKALEITKELGGANYVFWGGREGYETLLNTNMGLELDNMGRFLNAAADYAEEIEFRPTFLIEPKPKEPTKHQYDFDAATAMGFLRKYGLDKRNFKLNIEANHATLAGHTFQHELATSRINGMLGSIDANQGDPNLGWDTDQFPTDVYNTTLCMYEVLKNGGLHSGGLNFDAKVRRGSFTPEDLFLAHIAGMDAFAKGLRVAYRLLEDRVLEDFVDKRYTSFTTGIGAEYVEGKIGLAELEAYALEKGEVTNVSGRQELLETIVNDYIYEN